MTEFTLTASLREGAIYYGHRQKTKRGIRRQTYNAFQEASTLLWDTSGSA
ncbi:MAG: hypothetical protein UT61_C0053G0019 [Candidatus Woesebacteria bacterium GW2011_GWA1_39_8]|uniref:Uncharacterized protein n=1 Tax=Candidatus Woesebacteria bacterium GW2011_GWA1_39_8 TaxID=1618552 RepID=A0A0G0PK54_9BACT|nr:MAG: hypothetical protein UT61_C0053G0019 [Candidatus Woesebacteria bacterium GW2011_GWA1_39_8]